MPIWSGRSGEVDVVGCGHSVAAEPVVGESTILRGRARVPVRARGAARPYVPRSRSSPAAWNRRHRCR
jgi:hypothetical protein